MWLWRRVLRISWKDRKTNYWVRETTYVPKNKWLLEMVKKRKIIEYDHWKCRGDSSVVSTIEGDIGPRVGEEEDDTSR